MEIPADWFDGNQDLFSSSLENLQFQSPDAPAPQMMNQGYQIQELLSMMKSSSLPSTSRGSNLQIEQEVVQQSQASQLGMMQSSFPSPSSRVPDLQIGQECPQFENPQFAGANATMQPLVSPLCPQFESPRSAGIEPPYFFVMCAGPLSPSARYHLEQLAKEKGVTFLHPVPSTHILPPQLAEPSNPSPRFLQLHFKGNLPETVYTQEKIPKDSLKLELRDRDGSLVEQGLESSARVMLRLLDGGFAGHHSANLSRQELESKEVKPRKDKGPLLIGTTVITLVKGVAEVKDIAFSDISSKLTTNGAFRLGAELEDGGAREAVSEPFKVKVNRLKSRNKGPVSLEDSPCCLKYIKETNRLKLEEANIRTVKDVLQLYHADPGRLQQILHTSENKLSETVKSAESCPLTKEYYLYYDATARVRLILDCVFKVKAACFRDQIFKAFHVLDDSKKKLVRGVRFQAYQIREQLTRTDQHRTTWISIRAIFVFCKVAPKDSFEQHPRPAKRQKCYR